jgi:hypothetical protein
MRRIFAILLSIFGVAAAHGSVISVQPGTFILPNSTGQQMNLLISGTDFYTDDEPGADYQRWSWTGARHHPRL